MCFYHSAIKFHLHFVDLSGTSQLAGEEREKPFFFTAFWRKSFHRIIFLSVLQGVGEKTSSHSASFPADVRCS